MEGQRKVQAFRSGGTSAPSVVGFSSKQPFFQYSIENSKNTKNVGFFLALRGRRSLQATEFFSVQVPLQSFTL